MILEKINDDNDLRKLNESELKLLAKEIRSFLISTISKTGGHLASNLGVVELTIALHSAFNLDNNDSIVWDVGHQSYTHKILSGRKNDFFTLRKYGGISGFPKRSEDIRDTFNTGHSSTSISAAVGIAKANELLLNNGKSIAVIGDGAMTGGMVLEAINHSGQNIKNLIVILNDNEMSISKNVGGMARALKRLRNTKRYFKLKTDVKTALDSIPVVGTPTKYGIQKVKNDIKKLVIEEDSFFEGFGFTYLGPIDGHNFNELFSVLNYAKTINKPVFLHVYTKKGKGYTPAEINPGLYHGVGKFEPDTGKIMQSSNKLSWSDCFGESLCKLADVNNKIVAVTAAMPAGTGLKSFSKLYPKRFFDVGIAEQHAVTFSAGIATKGFIPVFAVYSTFLQRAYDQILHDVALQNIHVIFAIDRSGPVGEDGETHQGIYDISYLSHIPNMTVLSPATADDLDKMLKYAIEKLNGPVAIRYPRGSSLDNIDFDNTYLEPLTEDSFKKSRVISSNNNSDVTIISVGVMLKNVLLAKEILENKGIRVSIIDTVCIKPIDVDTIKRETITSKIVAVVENNVEIGGFGQQIESILSRPVIKFAYNDTPLVQGTVKELEHINGLTPQEIANKIENEIKGISRK